MHAGTAYNNKKTSRIHQKTPDEVSDMMKGRCCSHEMKGLMWTTQKEKKQKKNRDLAEMTACFVYQTNVLLQPKQYILINPIKEA